MSVLVKDMKMPKYCLECPFEDSPEFDSYCIAIGNEFIGKWEDLGSYKPDWCPLQDAPTVGEWIPVSERLPEDTSKPVLISGISGNYKGLGVYAVDIARYNGGMWQYDGFAFPDCDILAWMPLPEPYKGGDSE